MSSVRERHRRHGEVWWKGERVDSGDYCCACMGAWPCDAIQMDTLYRAALAGEACAEQARAGWEAEAKAARADADRLAAALRPFAVFDVDYPRKQDMRLAIARAALRQHEEATR